MPAQISTTFDITPVTIEEEEANPIRSNARRALFAINSSQRRG
jgi:hypothetical protein